MGLRDPVVAEHFCSQSKTLASKLQGKETRNRCTYNLLFLMKLKNLAIVVIQVKIKLKSLILTSGQS
jgi:hypothetical protein